MTSQQNVPVITLDLGAIMQALIATVIVVGLVYVIGKPLWKEEK